MSISSLSPWQSFLVLVLMVNTEPVSTEYTCSSTGSPSSSRTIWPSLSTFFTQFLRSTPMPPVTPTVVKKMGEMPLVPATTGAMLMKGTYSLACFPIHRATLFTPDMRDEPTPMVPFSATSMIRLSGCCFCSSRSSF